MISWRVDLLLCCYKRMCACLRVCIHTYVHTCVHTYIRTYIRTYIHTYIHIYIHTFMHIVHVFIPAITLQGDFVKWGPSVLFALVSALAAAFALILPETKGTDLTEGKKGDQEERPEQGHE